MPKLTDKKKIEKLTEAVDILLAGVIGYEMENGETDRYWEENNLNKAIDTLQEIKPDAKSLTYLEGFNGR